MTNQKKNLDDIPFQVANLISELHNKKNAPHVRDNYRLRLLAIRDNAAEAIKEYDAQMFMVKK